MSPLYVISDIVFWSIIQFDTSLSLSATNLEAAGLAVATGTGHWSPLELLSLTLESGTQVWYQLQHHHLLHHELQLVCDQVYRVPGHHPEQPGPGPSDLHPHD